MNSIWLGAHNIIGINWMTLRIFKLRRLLEKDTTLYGKPWMNVEYGPRTKILFSRFFSNEFCRRFKKDPDISQAIPLPEGTDQCSIR